MTIVKKLYSASRNWTPEMIEWYIRTDFKFMSDDEQRAMKHFMKHLLLDKQKQKDIIEES